MLLLCVHKWCSYCVNVAIVVYVFLSLYVTLLPLCVSGASVIDAVTICKYYYCYVCINGAVTV